MASPPCVLAGVRISCTYCNRHLGSRTCFDNHRRKHEKRPSVRVREIAGCATGPSHNEAFTNSIVNHVRETERTSVICNHYRTCCHPATRYCKYSMVLKQRRIPGTSRLPRNKFRIWYAYSSSVPVVRARKMSNKIVCDVVRVNTRFGRIR